MRRRLNRMSCPVALVSLAALLGGCSRPSTEAAGAPVASQAAGPAPAVEAVAWRRVAVPPDVDAAFEEARRSGRPLFLYWGASWCPPCNQLLATVFNRQDFIARSRAFVAVYVDGDKPGAQTLGARFGVRAYPTMVLFDRAGRELTRLPGEVEPARYGEVLALGMGARRPVAEVLAEARAGGRSAAALGADDWRLLAFYSWDTAGRGLPAEDERAAVLRSLADLCPPGQAGARDRLLLKALAFAGDADDARPDEAARERLEALLGDPVAARAQLDTLTNFAPEIVRAATAAGTPERARVLATFDGALRRFEGDATIGRADRLGATIARVQLARIDLPREQADPGLDVALREGARAAAGRIDRETTDRYERAALIPTAAWLLAQAGLVTESDALLEANLARSASPYYLMTALASNARRRGDGAAALRWSEQAFAAAVGPATRLQWGASHVGALVEFAPQDEARIEAVAAQLIDEAAAAPDGFHERSARSMQRAGARLAAWNRGGAHAAVFVRIKARLDAVCTRLPVGAEARTACEKVFASVAASQPG